LTASYRDLLQREQQRSEKERRVEGLELDLANLKSERDLLKTELLAAREKVHTVEALLSTTEGGSDNQLQSVSKQVRTSFVAHALSELSNLFLAQLATLELKELNERQRADHAVSRLQLSQAQGAQLEQRNAELEAKFADVAKANMELQRTERELRDKLVNSIPQEQVAELKEKVEVSSGFDNFDEIDEISLPSGRPWRRRSTRSGWRRTSCARWPTSPATRWSSSSTARRRRTWSWSPCAAPCWTYSRSRTRSRWPGGCTAR
jgi:hypothetical protein